MYKCKLHKYRLILDLLELISRNVGYPRVSQGYVESGFSSQKC